MDELEAGSPPPPYEAAAYPKTQFTRRLHKIFSFRVGMTFLVLAWLICFYAYGTHFSGSDASLSFPEQDESFIKCAFINRLPTRSNPRNRNYNPRWNEASGQNLTVILRNATLFDGVDFSQGTVDIIFSHGLITSVVPSQEGAAPAPADAEEVQLHGAYVTPGLVDMHSHHLVEDWPQISDIPDGNEMFADMGALTPFLRILDSMKAYDVATKLVASGGVTSSLIIPGSANIMGGEGAVVKNAWRSGPNGEFVVEEMLLEYGLSPSQRRRYMKMACGENPIGIYKHTRMGNAWVLRKWLARAKELMDKQDAWCAAARGPSSTQESRLLARKEGFPEELELESTVGMLRGKVAMHNHCYEPEDFETMLRISHEFGFRVRAFHHAIAAWQVPEMLKEHGE